LVEIEYLSQVVLGKCVDQLTMKYSLILGTVAAVVCFAPGAMALSPAEVEQKAKAVSVEMLTGVGSGVIIHHQGDLYTVITNRHVVCTVVSESCTERDIHSSYRLKTSDGRIYQVARSNIKLLKDDTSKFLDLAIVQFRSNRSYSVAQVAEPGSLKVEDAVYTAGFPKGQGWLFGAGKAGAVVNKRLVGDGGGYTVIYDAETLPGMSGGGAFDRDGRLVAVHGVGDRYTENTQVEEVASNIVKDEVNSKIGINRGIPVRWVVQSLGELGILVGNKRPLSRVGKPTVAATADEFFIAGFNKWVEPGADFQAGRRESLVQLNRAVAMSPRYTTAYFMRAYVKDLLNDPRGALADYNQAISLNPKYAVAYFNRAMLKENKLNDANGALADYNQFISLNPKYSEAYNNRGILKDEKLNDPKGALSDYNQAISLNPQNAAAYYNRGTLKKDKLNDPKGALADYNQAISLNPKFALAYNNLGTLKKDKLNDPKGALADYNQAISINPKYAPVYYNRGNLKYEKFNDPKGALTDYNQAISLNPKFAEAYNNRGNLKKDLNDPKGALADYNQAISLNPKFALAYNNRGNLKKDKLNDPEGALADYNQAISLNPKYAAAYNNRGILKKDKLNDPEGALADYNQVISLNPKFAEAYNNRGVLKKGELNDPKGALADYNQAISLNPKFALAYNNRGFLKYEKLKDRPGAIADFRVAAKLFRTQGQTQFLQLALEALRSLGATENP
jgi:tetratricopeptide (TPR) repeat protein/S1-C subfamily serine protease